MKELNVESSFEHSNKPSGSINDEKYLQFLSKYLLLKKGVDPLG
jgi:hypothetical protein